MCVYANLQTNLRSKQKKENNKNAKKLKWYTAQLAAQRKSRWFRANGHCWLDSPQTKWIGFA